MANVDNLNFKVIIDDKQFNQKIKAMEDMAKKFNTSMSNLLNVQAVSQQLVVSNRKRLQMETDLVRATEMQNREKIKTEGLQRKINAQIERASKGYQSQSRILQELKGYALGYLSIHGASQLLSSLVRVTGEFELQKTTLAAMLGDLNAAEGIITRIQGLAVESPFQFKELTAYAKQLSAFSVPAQELYDTTKMLADISAGLGVGMDRIVLAYGQVRSAAFLRGQEVRQFTEAGIPILDELAKQFSELEGRAVSTGEVFDKISARLVPFEMVAKVFKDMTSEGGKFYNMQEVQAETLRGKISNLKDAYEVMLNEIGKGQSENLKGAVDWARRLMQNYEETGRTLVELVAAYGIYRTALSLTSNHITTLTRAHAALRAQMRNLTKLLTKNPYAALAVGVTAAIGLIYKLGKEMNRQSVIAESMSRSQKKYQEDLNKSVVALDALKAKLDLAEKGSKDYNSAISAIQRNYAPYIEQLKAEGVEIDNLADVYGKLKEKVEESARARFIAFAKQDLDSSYAQKISDIIDGTGEQGIYNLKRAVNSLGLNDAEAIILRMFISGGATWEEITEKYADLASKVEKAYVSLGAGSSGPMKAKDYLDILKNSVTNLTNEYADATATIEEFTDAVINPAGKGSDPSLFVKKVQDTLREFGVTEGNKGKLGNLWATSTTEYYDYLDKLRKGYEEVKQKIKDAGSTQKANLPDLQKQKEAIEAIAKALEISLDKGIYGKGKSLAQKAIEEQIRSVQKLQDAYEKLMPYLNEVQMKSTLKSLFPNISEGVIDSLDFNAELERLADELAKFDEDAAQRLRDTIGKDVAGTIAESFRAVEQYKKMLDSWLGEDFNLSGEGVAFDISKIISNLNSEYAKIDQKREKALDMLNKAQMGDEVALAKVREVYGEEVWQKYLESGKKVIDDLAKKEKQESKKTADEKIRDLADKYVKEQMTSKNVDLTEFEDKTLAQIQTQIDRIKEIRDEAQKEANNAMADVALGNLDKGQYAKWQMFVDVLKQLDVVISDTEEEKSKKMLDNVQKSIGSISQLSGNVQALGDAMDNADVARFGEDLGKAADFASGLIESLKANDTIAIITNIASFVISEITNIVTASYEYQRKLNEAAREYRDIMFDIRRESYSGIFGTDEMALAAENAKILAEAQSKYQDVLKKFEDVRFQRFGGSFVRKDSISNTLSDFADANDWELYLDSGELNISALEAYYDAYSSRLTKKQRDLVQNLIESGKATDDAAAQQAEYLTSLFSGVADNIATSMVDAFIESGDAAIDMGNIISDVSKRMVADLIKSVYLMPILDSYKAQFDAIDANTALSPTESTEQKLALLDTALQQIADQSGSINETLERFSDYLGTGEEAGASGLGEGIKGITEDQANLLASYLNAIRADVSYSKTLWQRMDGNLQRIADMFTSSPTLMEYQAQIAANTYNTAVATQAILDRLVDVIGIGNDGSAIRVIS